MSRRVRQTSSRSQKVRRLSSAGGRLSSTGKRLSGSGWLKELDRKPSLHQSRFKQQWLHLAIAFLVPFCIYGYTAPRTIALEDDGAFVMASHFLGIAHPPGYPLHTLLGKLATFVPVGSAALRVHLLSSVFGALTCCLIWWICWLLFGRHSLAYTGSWTYAFSRVFWSQAIIAEVYTLNTFCFFLVFALALRYLADGRKKYLFLAALVFGLGLSNHWPLMVLSFPCFVFLLYPRRREIVSATPRVLLFLLLGLLPYLYLILRSRGNPVISFSGPLTTCGDFLYHVLRKYYSSLETSESVTILDKLRFVRFITIQMFHQFAVPGALLAAAGFFFQWKRWVPGFILALLSGWLGGTFILIFLLDFDYEFYKIAAFQVYPLIPYGIMVFWMCLGLDRLLHRVKKRRAMVETALVPLIVLAVLVSNFTVNDRSDYTWASEYARLMLDSLEKDAILFVHGDLDMGPAGYFNLVEKFRPDVDLYNDTGLLFGNRLFDPIHDSQEAKDRAVRNFITGTIRPVYYTTSLPLESSVHDFGLFKKLRRDASAGVNRFSVDDRTMAFIESMEARTLRDPWTVYHRNTLRQHLGRILAYTVYLSDVHTRVKPLFDKVFATFHGRLGILGVNFLLTREKKENLMSWIVQAESMLDETVTKGEHALLYRIKGRLLLSMDNTTEALESLEKSVVLYPNRANEAVLDLLKLYARLGHKKQFDALKDRFDITVNRQRSDR